MIDHNLTMEADVATWFAETSNPVGHVMRAVRDVIMEDPDVSECLKYRAPAFESDGLICYFNWSSKKRRVPPQTRPNRPHVLPVRIARGDEMSSITSSVAVPARRVAAMAAPADVPTTRSALAGSRSIASTPWTTPRW